MKWLFLLYCSKIVFLKTCYSANIVAFIVAPLYSHQITFKPFWLELASRGHNITLFQSHVIIEGNENVTHVIMNETFAIAKRHGLFDKLANSSNILNLLSQATTALEEVLKYQMTLPEVGKLLRGEIKADLIFTELMATHNFVIGHKLNVPTIGILSMDGSVLNHEALGNPTHPIAYPDKDAVSPSSAELTFFERIRVTLFWVAINIFGSIIAWPLQEDAIRNNWGLEVDLKELEKNVSMMFVNANPIFNVIRPLGPRTINIGGGVHLLKPKPLPKELQEYLDRSANGVIYLSLGSTITSEQVPNATRDVILKTFSQLPYKILWKFEEDIPTPPNVKIMKWLPQQDLFRHKNVKLFITQGGIQSMEEAIFNYVPMVVLPFFGDQHGNAKKVETKRLGLTLDYKKLDVETFKNTILEVVGNPKYKKRVQELADLVMDQPMTAVERAVWWTEYVLRHRNLDHLQNPIVNLPWYQYLFLDIIGFLVLVVVTIVYAVRLAIRLIRCLIHKMYRYLTKTTKTKTN